MCEWVMCEWVSDVWVSEWWVSEWVMCEWVSDVWVSDVWVSEWCVSEWVMCEWVMCEWVMYEWEWKADREMGWIIVAVTTKRQISRFSLSKDELFPLFCVVISVIGKIIMRFVLISTIHSGRRGERVEIRCIVATLWGLWAEHPAAPCWRWALAPPWLVCWAFGGCWRSALSYASREAANERKEHGKLM